MYEHLSNPGAVRRVLDRYGIRFRKRFGQNFLIREDVVEDIVSSAGITEEDAVIEIGPGIGTMTQVLAEHAHSVTAVEIDRDLVQVLKETLSGYDNTEVICGDILKVDLRALVREKGEGRPVKVVANLPYYITTPILMELLESGAGFESITVMVQKEVAERVQAGPGTKAYGVLSLAVQYRARPEVVLDVPASSFMPSPNVDSAVLHLKLFDKPAVAVKDEEFLFRLIKAAFGQRRKTMVNAVSSGALGLSKQQAAQALAAEGLSPQVRGETLSLEQFARLSDRLCQK
ncbi:MAG: 16S rRNA (adenine(1518)-N(6)/adenine(1519)-N(6))-dimethyltransferase RsmA [Lachnospiraceae bacterium]|jgi:16S rRNA (adenine1518-N6/adenine1519-N6)-dimethyltransferase